MWSKWVLASLATALITWMLVLGCGDDPIPMPTTTTTITPMPTPTTTIPPIPTPAGISSSQVLFGKHVLSNCGPFYYYGGPFVEHDYTPDILLWTRDGTHIIFDNSYNSGWDIYLLEAGGSYLRRIVDARSDDLQIHGSYADISGDGTRIVYASCEYISGRELYSPHLFFSSTGAPLDPIFTIDDRERYNYEIVTRKIDGSDPRRLTENIVMDHYPVWSPDGSLVAFVRSSERLSDIVISSPDGSDQRAIAGLRGISLWSSDGSDVRFSQPYLIGIHQQPRDPAEQRIRTNLVATSISWSADGSEIRFVGAPKSMESNGDAPVHAGIFSVGVDGTGMRIISEIEWPALVSWSSDGSRVAVRRITQTYFSYLSSRRKDLLTPEAVLYTMASDGSDRRVLVSETPRELVAEHSDWRDPTDDIDACSEGYVVLDPRDNPGLVQDCETLLRARRALAGDGFLNWGAEVRITEWDGVRFVSFSNAFPNESNGQSDRDTKSPQRVRGLYLFGMRSTLPPELGDLTALEWLWFGVHGGSRGSMGSIPPELGNLTNLTHLIMYRAGLTGSIPPELGNLSNLRKLHLSENNLAGSIPPELGNLSSLEELDLSWNRRLTGRIPLEVWNLWSAGVLQDADVRGTSLRHPLGECEGRVFWRFLECRIPIE